MTVSDLLKFRAFGRRFVVSISGGGSAFISDYLEIPGASATFLEALVPYSQDATDAFLGYRPANYCSEKTARQLASQALRRAFELDERAQRRQGGAYVEAPLVGVGVTASLASDRPKKGAHRVYCAVQSREGTFSAALDLKKDARTRGQEERLAADFILSTLLFAADADAQSANEIWREKKAKLPLKTELALYPEDAAQVAWAVPDKLAANLLFPKENVEIAAVRWFNGKIDKFRTASGQERGVDGGADSNAERAIYPGSFNPPHRGHVKIARLAQKRLNRAIELEISARNVDKPPLDALELSRRLAEIARALPDVPVWISNAPRYVEKAVVFPDASFIMGTDTVLRLADPKYEDNSIERRDAVLSRLHELRASICVFARKVDGELLSEQQLKERLPERLTSLCDFVPETVFLDDASSTEIRNGAEPRR